MDAARWKRATRSFNLVVLRSVYLMTELSGMLLATMARVSSDARLTGLAFLRLHLRG
jgi:hypothetical protein